MIMRDMIVRDKMVRDVMVRDVVLRFLDWPRFTTSRIIMSVYRACLFKSRLPGAVTPRFEKSTTSRLTMSQFPW